MGDCIESRLLSPALLSVRRLSSGSFTPYLHTKRIIDSAVRKHAIHGELCHVWTVALACNVKEIAASLWNDIRKALYLKDW